MANWCMNRVEFKANETQIKAMEQYFLKMSKKEFETKHGQLPDFILSQTGFLHEIDIDANLLTYQTKWAPNTNVVVAIARHFQVDFTYNFEEYGMQIFGEAVFNNGKLTVFELTQADLQQFVFNEDTETYRFESVDYELIDDIVEILLSRKKLAEATN